MRQDLKTAKVVQRIARQVRQEMAVLSSFPKGYCYTASSKLQHLLERENITATIIDGRVQTKTGLQRHFWLQLNNGVIVDITGDQFNNNLDLALPEVLIGRYHMWKIYRP